MKYLLFLLIALIALSCSNVSNTAASTTQADVDSLTSVFVVGWNNKDSAAVMKVIAEDAIVMNDTLIYKGQSSIAEKWVSGGLKILGNITVSSIAKNSDDKIAYTAGTYTGDLTPPGGHVLKEKGNYSFGWTKQASGEWKLTLIHIEDVSRIPVIQ
jgi:ketosteroid isomerase-like protein